MGPTLALLSIGDYVPLYPSSPYHSRREKAEGFSVVFLAFFGPIACCAGVKGDWDLGSPLIQCFSEREPWDRHQPLSNGSLGFKHSLLLASKALPHLFQTPLTPGTFHHHLILGSSTGKGERGVQ